MFRWRKRNDGFEWREYVRTTIIVRRGDRRRRIEEVKQAAIADLKVAGQKGAGAMSSGLSAAGRGLLAALAWLATVPGRVYGRFRPVLAPYVLRTTGKVANLTAGLLDRLAPAFSVLRRREIYLTLILVGCIATVGAAHRYFRYGFDEEVTYSGLIALAAVVLLALPAYARGARLHVLRRLRDGLERLGLLAQRIPGLDRVSVGQAGSIAVAVALAVAGGWYALGPTSDATVSRVAQPGSHADGVLEGRAVALSGDSLRLNGRVLKLAGIEAPEREQICQRPKTGGWRCGDAARSVLDRLIRGRRVACILTGRSDAEPTLAECRVAGEDLAESLLRAGHVFAVSGPFTRFASLENEARSANVGVWFGTAERPAEYRAKKWEEAKRNAPEGCPIKGQVAGRARIYVLPWSPAYDSVTVRAAKGERWFCSEEEARAAGWKATARS